MTLEMYEEKWSRKTKVARDKWVTNIRDPSTIEAYVNKIARLTGLSPDTVRASSPAQEFANFTRNVDRYVSEWLSGIDTAIAMKKWSQKYREAFATPARP